MKHIRETLDELGYKPIPTEYNGVTYRSRLEARWAVFLDAIGLEHYYELEGFQLPSGWYVPDFWLPRLASWLEIKPHPIRDGGTGYHLAEELCEVVKVPVLLAYGPPGGPGSPGGWSWQDMDGHFVTRLTVTEQGIDTDWPLCFSRCVSCGVVCLESLAADLRLCGKTCSTEIDPSAGWPIDFEKARQAALRARFWDP